MNKGVALHPPGTSTTPITSNITDYSAEQVQTSALHDKLPLIVTQQPSSSSALPKINQGEEQVIKTKIHLWLTMNLPTNQG